MLTARKEHACVEWEDKILVIGGKNRTGDGISSVESYDSVTNTWSSFTLLPVPLLSLQAVVHKNHLYVLGARIAIRGWNRDVYQLRPGSGEWEVVPGVKVRLRSRGVFPAVIFDNLHCH